MSTELQTELVRRKGEIIAYLRAADAAASGPALERAPRDGDLPVSFSQERLWFLQRLDPDSVAYNLQANVSLPGPLAAAALERALSELARRHEVLRTSFVAREGRPVQVVAAPRPITVPVTDLAHLAGPEREATAERIATEEVRQPFDLEQGPVFRVRLLRLREDDHQLGRHLRRDYRADQDQRDVQDDAARVVRRKSEMARTRPIRAEQVSSQEPRAGDESREEERPQIPSTCFGPHN